MGYKLRIPTIFPYESELWQSYISLNCHKKKTYNFGDLQKLAAGAITFTTAAIVPIVKCISTGSEPNAGTPIIFILSWYFSHDS